MRKLKKLLIGVGILAAALAIMYICVSASEKSALKKLSFEEIDMLRVADGVYIGSASTNMVKAEVKVTVENHKISAIELIKHDNLLGKKAEAILGGMISANTYDVDAVTGATASSQVIKSAVCSALLKGLKE